MCVLVFTATLCCCPQTHQPTRTPHTSTQVLPLVPPDPEYYSPYSGLDTNCGNPLLIDLEALITEGLLDRGDAPPTMPDGDVQFEKVGRVGGLGW